MNLLLLKLLNLLLLKLLIVVGIMCSSFIEAVESVVEAVDCCRLLCAIESSSFVEVVESLLQMLIVVGYYVL